MDIKYINRATGTVVTEHPPKEDVLRFLYNNPFGKRVVLPLARQKFITRWYGKIMDSGRSTNRIQPFIDSLGIDMSEAERPASGYATFNEFFYRKLKPGLRPVGDGLVSPGDGKLLAFERVSEVNTFHVKGEEFTLRSFLNDDQLAHRYDGSSMVILRLAPSDYHRYHFPYAGVPTEAVNRPGRYYSVSPIALGGRFNKVFSKNKKQVCRLSTETQGEMLIIPVGATMVGSLNSTYEAGQPVTKGQEMGYFAFGGSSVVLLFDPAFFAVDEDLLRNTRNELETSVRMGESIGRERSA